MVAWGYSDVAGFWIYLFILIFVGWRMATVQSLKIDCYDKTVFPYLLNAKICLADSLACDAAWGNGLWSSNCIGGVLCLQQEWGTCCQLPFRPYAWVWGLIEGGIEKIQDENDGYYLWTAFIKKYL